MYQPFLMIAFHYPPAQASGTQRTLSFSVDLPEFGWRPIILSAHPRAYEKVDWQQLSDIPPDCVVYRPLALDAARHLAFKGRYSRLTALPDRWASWFLSAVPVGLYLILRHRPQLIWTTYPLPTTLKIGYALHRLTKLPWVIDLRDPLVTGHNPRDPLLKEHYKKLERQAVTHCTRIVVSTPGLQRFLMARYPELPPEKWLVIPNGYDEKSFHRLETLTKNRSAATTTITLIHSGTLYTGLDERNPAPFLNALLQLRHQGVIGSHAENSPETIGLKIIFRATSHDTIINAMISKRGLSDIITIAPPLSYQEAIGEMMQMDGLLLFQGSGFNHLIPAKLFEYLRTFRPIFALTGADGDSAQILQEAGIHTIAPLEEEATILPAFKQFLTQIRTNTPQTADQAVVATYSRRLQAKRLATLFDEMLHS